MELQLRSSQGIGSLFVLKLIAPPASFPFLLLQDSYSFVCF